MALATTCTCCTGWHRAWLQQAAFFWLYKQVPAGSLIRQGTKLWQTAHPRMAPHEGRQEIACLLPGLKTPTQRMPLSMLQSCVPSLR